MARWSVQHPGASAVGPVDAAELRAAWDRKQVPPGTMVCAEGFSQWVPFHTIAELVDPSVAGRASSLVAPLAHRVPRPERLPTRAGAVIAGLIIVPLFLLILHIVLFGESGVLGPSVVVALGIVSIVVVAGTSLRLKPPRELLTNLPFMIPVALVLLAGEGLGLGAGLSATARHGQIVEALASRDACAVESVSEEDVRDLATDSERGQLAANSEECRGKRATERCTRAARAVEQHEKTMPEVGDTTTTEVAVRLARRALLPADLALAKKDLQCSDLLWPLLVGIASEVPGVWAGGTTPAPSDDLSAALAAHGLSAEVQTAVGAQAELAAKAVLKKTTTEEMVAAARLCDLSAAAHLASTASCVTLGKRYAQAKTKEGAVAAREAATQEADFRARQRTHAAARGDCESRLSAAISLCKVGCSERYSSFDPGPAREEQISKCASNCYTEVPSFSDCK
jgi:hypothetical protein